MINDSTRTRRPGALLVAGLVIGAVSTACSPAQAPSAAHRSATYVAEMPTGTGTQVTMAITVSGDKIAAYETNGVDDDAWFFGTKHDGTTRLFSVFHDTMTASFDGSHVTGTLAMNEPGSVNHAFIAQPVSAPAGLFTADLGNARATWVVHPGHPTVGVMNNSAPGDHKLTDQLASDQEQFQDVVRQMRLERNMVPAPPIVHRQPDDRDARPGRSCGARHR